MDQLFVSKKQARLPYTCDITLILSILSIYIKMTNIHGATYSGYFFLAPNIKKNLARLHLYANFYTMYF
jgi:hypothetical protein